MQHVKRILCIVLLLAASAALGDERTEKRRLVSELLEVLDAKALVQASFEGLTTVLETRETSAEEIPEEYRATFEEERRKEEEEVRKFQERMFAHIDYAKLFESTTAPALEEQFTADELRRLIDFFRTKEGQKLAGVLPRLGHRWRLSATGRTADE
jgi:hypothetical protein